MIRKEIKEQNFIVIDQWTILFSVESLLHPIKPFELSNLIYKQKYWHMTLNCGYVKLTYEWAVKNVSWNRSVI